MSQQKEVVIVTGCSGRIGMKAIHLLSQKYQVVGFDIYRSPLIPPEVEFMYVDLGSTDSVKSAFNRIRYAYGDRIASVIHLAAYYSFTGERADLYEKITVRGTERLLNACHDFKVEQFLFTSTMLVHVPCDPSEKITEESPIAGSWDYPSSKIKTEQLIREIKGDIPCVILRIAGCYDDQCHSIPISNQIQRIYEKQAISCLFPGKVSHGAAFLHLDDLEELLGLCFDRRKELPKDLLLVVAEEETLSYDRLQREISRFFHGKEWSTLRIPKWFGKMGAWLQDRTPFMPPSFVKPWMIDLADQNYTINVDKTRAVLGWEPKRLLSKTLPKMFEFLQKDPAGFYRANGLSMPSWLKKKLEEHDGK